MVRLKQLYKCLPLLFLVAAKPAFADGPPQEVNFIGLYDFTWSGLALAKAEFAITETKDTYNLHLALRLAGLVKLFTKHRSDTVAHGRRKGDQYFPELYESHYWTKDKPRHIKISFDAKGVVKDDIVEPPENPAERPVVPHELKDGTLDPLTLLLAVNAGNLSPKVYDAKHLYQGDAVKGEQVDLRTYNGPRAAVPYELTRKPLAGLTEKETKDFAKGEPTLTFFFSADGNGIPLYATMSLYLGSLKGTLSKECKTWDECKID